MSMIQFPAGSMSLLDNPVFESDPYDIFNGQSSPTDAGAEMEIQADGDVFSFRTPGVNFRVGGWGNPSLDISDFDFRLDTISGTLNFPGSDAADTWIAGSTIPRWGVEETGFGTTTFTGTLRVRPSGGGDDFDTAAVSLEAEST